MIQSAKSNAAGMITSLDLECGDQYTLLLDEKLILAFYDADPKSEDIVTFSTRLSKGSSIYQ